MKKDIHSLEDIEIMVDEFYAKVIEDENIGPIFKEKIGDRWAYHLQKMYDFWQTVLLEEHTYSGRPFPPHAQLEVSQVHFDTWIALFEQTLDARFSGDKTEEAKYRAKQMAAMFLRKIEYFKGYTGKTLL